MVTKNSIEKSVLNPIDCYFSIKLMINNRINIIIMISEYSTIFTQTYGLIRKSDQKSQITANEIIFLLKIFSDLMSINRFKKHHYFRCH
jgi:hypothetical protein